MSRLKVLSVFLLVAFIAGAVNASQVTGIVKVKNANTPIAGALIQAKRVAATTNDTMVYRAVSGPDGRYLLPLPLAGNYMFNVSAPGYLPHNRGPIVISDSLPLWTLNFELEKVSPTANVVAGNTYDDSTRLALPGVTLTLRGGAGTVTPVFTTTSGDLGMFKFSSLPRGAYQLSAEKAGYNPYQHPAVLQIDSNTQITNLKIYLKKKTIVGNTATISGGVFQYHQVLQIPIPNALVKLISNAGNVGYSARTDSTGHFTMLNVPFGTYAATCEAAGYQPSQQTLSVQMPQVTLTFLLHQSPVAGASVSGNTYNDSTRQPLGNVRLDLMANGSLPFLLTVYSGSDGFFKFAQVPRGSYTLTAAREGFAAYAHPTPIVIDSLTNITNLKIYLKPLLATNKSIVKGTVTKAVGGAAQPVMGATIRLAGANGAAAWTSKSDSAGQYKIPEVPYGAYLATCEAPGLSTATQQVTVQSAVTQLNFTLTPTPAAGVSVSGKVFDDSTNAPLGGVRLILKYNTPVMPPVLTAVSDNTGAFKFVQVPRGVYLLTAEKEGYQPYTSTSTITIDTVSITNLVVQMKKKPGGGTLAKVGGRVYAQTSAGTQVPVAGAKITINGIISFVPVITYSDSLGKYVFPAIPYGEFTATCEAAGFGAVTKPLSVQAPVVELNFALTQGGGSGFGTVAGKVADDSTMKPLKGVQLALRANNILPYLFNAVSDSAGLFKFAQVPRGSYLLTATREGYLPYQHSAPIQIDSGTQITNLNILMKKLSGGGTLATVKGRVLSKVSTTGVPIPNAFIRLIGPDTAVYTATSDASGAYVIQNVRYGAYQASCSAAGFLSVTAQINVQSPVVEFSFYLQPVPTPGMAAIKGKVVFDETNGTPVKGAVIEFLSPNNPAGFTATAVTDIEGRYTGMVMPGTYIISCKFADPATNYMYKEYWDNVQNIAQATPVPVQANDTVRNINFGIPRVPVGNTITVKVIGLVKDNQNRPLANAKVSAVMMMSPDSTRFTAVSASSGEYVITMALNRADSLNKVFVVMAAREGFKPEFYREKTTITTADKFYVLRDTVFKMVDFTLEPLGTALTYSIAGKISTAQAAPIAGAFVIGSNALTGEMLFAFTNAAGQYTLSGLKPGKYFMLFAATGFVPEFYNNVLRWENATPVVVNANVANINAELAPATVLQPNQNIITGIILDNMGAPLQSALVWISDPDENVITHTFTDGNGAYEISGVSQGAYILSATKVGYVSSSQPIQFNPQINNTLIHNFNLPSSPVGVDNQSGVESPSAFRLYDNYPNPFNPSTVVRFGIPAESKVRLTVFNSLGQVVAELFDGTLQAGTHAVTFDAGNLSSGIYLIRMETPSFTAAKKLILQK